MTIDLEICHATKSKVRPSWKNARVSMWVYSTNDESSRCPFQTQGVTNKSLINARHQYALIYNDLSPLENHHAAITFTVMNSEKTDLMKAMSLLEARQFKTKVVSSILATDMIHHFDLVQSFSSHIEFVAPPLPAATASQQPLFSSRPTQHALI